MYPKKEGFYFLQDGAPSHTCEASSNVLKKIFGNKVIQNPPNSPDWNVLDFHTWDHLGKMVQKSDIKTLPDLKRGVVRAFKNVNMEEVRKAIKSWKKRMEACLKANGDRFEFAM